jgi:hypothetical protein
MGEAGVTELHDFGAYSLPQLLDAPSGRYQVQAATNTVGVIYLSGHTAGWVVAAAKKLDALGRFRANWDSYGGLPLQPGAKALTLRALDCLRLSELPTPAVVLGSGGTVQLEWHNRQKELDLELRDDDTVEYVKVQPDGHMEEGEATKDLALKLRELAQWLVRN